MTDTAANLRRKIDSATDLKGVVRTMKALAASSITQYEKSVLALADYYRTVELGLSASFRASLIAQHADTDLSKIDINESEVEVIGAIVFGSDQGLVGQFNEDIAQFALTTLAKLPGQPTIWTVGERVQTRLADAPTKLGSTYNLPTSVIGIAPLIGHLVAQIQQATERQENNQKGSNSPYNTSYGIYVFHNRPTSGALYEPTLQRLLPLDQQWLQSLAEIEWPNSHRPEILCPIGKAERQVNIRTRRALIREYLFISIFRACAESLASENASRLAAMQRAEKNIDDLQEKLGREFNRLRQSAIDEELFDVVAGYELLSQQH